MSAPLLQTLDGRDVYVEVTPDEIRAAAGIDLMKEHITAANLQAARSLNDAFWRGILGLPDAKPGESLLG